MGREWCGRPEIKGKKFDMKIDKVNNNEIKSFARMESA